MNAPALASDSNANTAEAVSVMREGPLYGLLAIPLLALATAADLWWLPLLLLVPVGVHPLLAGRFVPRPGLLTYLLLATPFAFLSRSAPVQWRTGLLFLGLSNNFATYGLLFLLLIGIVRLYRQPGPQRTSWVLIVSGVTMAAVGGGLYRREYLGFMVPYAVAMLLALRGSVRIRRISGQSRWRHEVAVASAAALAALTVVGLVWVTETHGHRVGRLLGHLGRGRRLAGSVGFTDTVKLGSVEDRRHGSRERQVAVRAFSDAAPGYLRGRAFRTYEDGAWTVEGVRDRQLKPDRGEGDQERLGRVVLPGGEALPRSEPWDMEVFPTRPYRAHFFLPLRTAAVETHSEYVYRGYGGVLRTRHRPTTRGYRVYLGTDSALREGGGDQDEAEYALGRDPGLRRALGRVIAKLGLTRGTGPDVVVERLKAYFADNYTYRIGIRFEEGDRAEDVLTQFLEEKAHGHCELFASAGTLLLRRVGIRSRYVTGFVCEEKSPYGGLYLARNRHAHAWVEAYLPGRGWQTVEFTPPAAQPGRDGSTANALWEYVRSLLQWANGYGAAGLLDLVLEGFAVAGRWILAAWWRVAALIVAILFFFLWRHGRERVLRLRNRPPRSFSLEVEALRQEFFALEKRLSREGVGRHNAETLLSYARRVEAAEVEQKDEAVDLICRLAAVRYGPEADG
jgi:transglutaminase-like putative cysteine protease